MSFKFLSSVNVKVKEQKEKFFLLIRWNNGINTFTVYELFQVRYTFLDLLFLPFNGLRDRGSLLVIPEIFKVCGQTRMYVYLFVLSASLLYSSVTWISKIIFTIDIKRNLNSIFCSISSNFTNYLQRAKWWCPSLRIF